MNEFMNKMYSYENFGIYLILAIVILVILFFVILFFGKKDKKNRELEETKRLEKLNPDLFKVSSTEEKLEVDSNNISPITNDAPTNNNEPVLPIVNDTLVKEDNNIDIPTIKEEIKPVDLSESAPVLNKEEEKPLVFSPVEDIKLDDIMTSNIEENNMDDIKIDEPSSPLVSSTINNFADSDKEELPEVPEFNKESIDLDIDSLLNNVPEDSEEETPVLNVEPEKNVQVFSSVYVPEKSEEEKSELVNTSTDIKPSIEDLDDDEDFDLPQLKGHEEEKKEEVKEEINVEPFNTVNIDSISGETFEIR